MDDAQNPLTWEGKYHALRRAYNANRTALEKEFTRLQWVERRVAEAVADWREQERTETAEYNVPVAATFRGCAAEIETIFAASRDPDETEVIQAPEPV